MGEKVTSKQAVKESSWIWRKLEQLNSEDGEHRLMTFYSPNASYARSSSRFYEIACGIAAWLRHSGVDDGDYVGIDGPLRFKALATWCACLYLGAVAVFYPDAMRQEARESDAAMRKTRVVVVQDPERAKLWLEARGSSCKKLKYILYMDVRGQNETVIDQLLGWPLPDNVFGFEACVEQYEFKPKAAYERRSDLPCAVVFSQGTTAGPRPQALSSDMIRAGAQVLVSMLQLVETDSVFYAPDSICAATLSVFAASIASGACFVFRFRINDDLEMLQLIDQSQPHCLFMLPRQIHKLKESILTQSSKSSFHTRWNQLCVTVGKFRKRNNKSYLNWSKNVIDSVFLRHFKNRLGENCRAIISFGAPLLSKDAEFFSFIDIPVYNAYAAVEAGGFAHIRKFGAEGGFLPTCDHQIQKGMLYLRALGRESFESTGDYVFEDERCGLCVKRVEKVKLENGQTVDSLALRDALVREPLIEEVLICGEGRTYLTALIYLDKDQLLEWAKAQKIYCAGSFPELCQNPRVYAFVKARVDACTANRASYEEIRKIALLTTPLSQDPFILTETGLVRRYEVEEKYKGIINSFYSDDF